MRIENEQNQLVGIAVPTLLKFSSTHIIKVPVVPGQTEKLAVPGQQMLSQNIYGPVDNELSRLLLRDTTQRNINSNSADNYLISEAVTKLNINTFPTKSSNHRANYAVTDAKNGGSDDDCLEETEFYLEDQRRDGPFNNPNNNNMENPPNIQVDKQWDRQLGRRRKKCT